MEFIYTIDPNSDEPIMVIDGPIGPDEIGEDGILTKGVNGAVWAKELMTLDSMNKRRIRVYINSPGGVVAPDGFNICSAMLHTKCKVDTYCRGLVASMAAVAFMCGRDRYMADYGILMFHDPYGSNDSEALKKIKDSLGTIIAKRSGLAIETVSAIMARTTWMDASEAVDLDLITDVEITSQANVGRLSPLKNDAKAFWIESKAIFNNSIAKENKPAHKVDNNRIMDFKKINNKLGLMDEASAESTITAIEALKNEAKEFKTKAEDFKNKAEDASKKLCEMEDKLNKMKSDMDEAKKQKEAYDTLNAEYLKLKSEMEAKNKADIEKAKTEAKEKAKNMIAQAAKDGKIENKAEVLEKWTVKAEADPEGIKDLLDTMGVSAKGPDFSVIKDLDKDGNKIEIKDAADFAALENKLFQDHLKSKREAIKK